MLRGPRYVYIYMRNIWLPTHTHSHEAPPITCHVQTAVMGFEDSEGYLVGKPNNGMKEMFAFMNTGIRETHFEYTKSSRDRCRPRHHRANGENVACGHELCLLHVLWTCHFVIVVAQQFGPTGTDLSHAYVNCVSGNIVTHLPTIHVTSSSQLVSPSACKDWDMLSFPTNRCAHHFTLTPKPFGRVQWHVTASPNTRINVISQDEWMEWRDTCYCMKPFQICRELHAAEQNPVGPHYKNKNTRFASSNKTTKTCS